MALLEASGIGKNFGETKVLKDISLNLEQGEALAIIGSSGSGKTTLLRCLNFLERPDTGIIKVNGETMWDATATQASRQREQQARLARQSAEDQQAIRALQSRYTALQSRQRAAADALSQNIAQAAQKAARELHASGKATAENAASLQRTAQAKAEALSHKWSTQNDALLAQYSADLHASFQETRTQLEARKADLSRLHSTLAGDDAQTRRLAQEQLDTARIAIQSFEVEFGRSPAAEDYHRAVEYFNGGLYENAHSLASAVALDVYTQLEKALVQQAKDDFLRTAIHTMVRTGQARIHALENCTVPYQGVEYNEDLTRFVPDVFAALKTCLQQQEHALESASSAELAKARADVSELLQDVDCATRTAARQMIYAYSENDSGELVQSAMFQQGYTCTGYAYKHRLEGQPLHINFEKALTGEKVTVELIPDDHGVALNVHNFGRQAGTPMSAHAQDTLRNNLVAALNQSGALRVPCHASCSNSGVSSSAAQAADLHAVSQ